MTEIEEQMISDNIARVQENIARAAALAGRKKEEITLVAATKMNHADRVRYALQNGVDAAGENRVQELLEKYERGAYKGKPLHFIGNLQTNKVKYLVGKVDLIESVSSVNLGQAIAREAEKKGLQQGILLEINIGKEDTKSGFAPEQIMNVLDILSRTPALKIRGLMAIPPRTDGFGKNIHYFSAMQQLFVDISSKKYDNTHMDLLSMGMSGDYMDAIAYGSNMVRIGSAIFGARNY